MKITITKIVCILAAVLLCVNCGQEEIKTERLELTPQTITIDAHGGQENISVLCSEDWVASSSDTWAKLLTISGKASDSPVMLPVLILQNPQTEARSAVITVKTISMATATVTVSQGASDGTVGARGIATEEDLFAFAQAVNNGGSLSAFMQNGEVTLLKDIVLSGKTAWEPVGTETNPYTGRFNGNSHTIRGIDWKFDLSKTPNAAFFGCAKNAVIKDLTLGNEGESITVNGTASSSASVSAFCGVATGTSFSGLTSNLDINFTGDCRQATPLAIGGICGKLGEGSIMGGSNSDKSCVNNGNISTGRLSNTMTDTKAVNIGGICGYSTAATTAPTINFCINKGRISSPVGCTGGVVGYLETGKMTNSSNDALIEDDLVGQFSSGQGYTAKRLGGLCGYIGVAGKLSSCTNNGDVYSHIACLAGGFAGYSDGIVEKSTNRGNILSDSIAPEYGPAWGCACNPKNSTFLKNNGYGHVGSWSQYKDKASEAPDAMFYNAVLTPKSMFDTETTTVDWTLDSYYDWTLDESRKLAEGCTYSRYICTNVPRRVCVLEVDLKAKGIDLTTAYSDDIVPNPNANNNSNNGPCIRETLSQLCERKRSEGQNIIAGINTGFFDSTNGYSRGPHVEEGEPVYINSPSTRKGLPNHDWAFTVFEDRTASCGRKSFAGSAYGPAGQFSIGGVELNYYTINEIILRSIDASYDANVYTYRYVKTPHPKELPTVQNTLAKNAYYLVCRFTSGIMKVNCGYTDAVVTAIHDGRVSPLAEGPYVTGKDEFVVQLSGDAASKVSAVAGVGSALKIRSEIAVNGVVKPIYTQNATMFQFMVDGNDASQTAPAGHTNLTTYDPVTYAAVSQDGTKVWLIEVDGRQAWFSMGLKSYEMYRIAKKLGAWNMSRFDGGGSSCMWVYDSASGKGSLVNRPSDKKGERSCLNYILIRQNE